MRLHLLAAATSLTLALSACVSSGGLHPDGTPTDDGIAIEGVSADMLAAFLARVK